MKAITFSLTTQQPLLATSFQGDPNSDVSYSYIPGSMIRGAIIGRYMKLHHLSELDLTNNEAKRLFFSASSTRYLNAYLLSQDKQQKRTLPTPLSWFKDKDAELPESNSTFIQVYDRAQEYELPEEVEPKKVEQKFCTVNGVVVVLYSERRRINIHNQRDRKKGRSTPTKRDRQTGQIIVEGEGEIFRYEAIDAEQAFQAVILCNDNDTDLLKGVLEKSEDLWLGGSQSAGYGHTKIRDVTVHDTWNEIGLPAKKRVNCASLTITLLSDLILRDEWGQYAAIPPRASKQEDCEQEDAKQQTSAPLTKSLKIPLGVDHLEPKASFASSTLVGGFNRKWGLHLPQVPVLTAGSVFVFEKISLTAEQIQQLEEQGIGERRNEGFGRVAVNWLQEELFQARQPEPFRVIDQPTLRLESSRFLAAQMAERLLKQKLERKLQNKVGCLTLQGNITNNQLSRLQLVALQALSTRDLNLVLSLLDNLPSNARGQFELTKMGTESAQSLKQQLYEWLRNPGSWINSRDLAVRVADVERGVTDELAREYTLRLIMAVAKKAIKERN